MIASNLMNAVRQLPFRFLRKDVIMSSINGMGRGGFSMMQGMQRPNPAKMVDNFFAKIDTSGKGYIEKSDLQSALNQLSSKQSASNVSAVNTTASADEIFNKLDGNSDGKITKDEMSSAVTKLADALNSQYNEMRMSGSTPGGQGGMQPPGGMQNQGGMPPPPPPGGGSKPDLSKDQLSSLSSSLASSDSQRASQMNNLANNFEAADTNSDGKISFQEAMAYEQANPTSDVSSSAKIDVNAASSGNSDASILKQIMGLMQAYSDSNYTSNSAGWSALA